MLSCHGLFGCAFRQRCRQAAIQANACLLAFSSFSMQQPTHMLIDPATEILGMSPIYSMDNNNMVACTARPKSANGSEPCAGRQPGSCCCVCWVGLLRRVPCRSGRAANRLMECPAQRETRQGAGQRQDAPPWQWHAWQRADTEEKPRIWPSQDLISQLTIRLVDRSLF